MKHKKLLTLSIVVVLLVALLIVISAVSKTDPLDYTYNHSEGTLEDLQRGDYKNYQLHTGQTIVYPSLVNGKTVIPAFDYDEGLTSMATRKGNIKQYKDLTQAEKDEVLKTYDANKTPKDTEYFFIESDSGKYLETSEVGSITFVINVAESGFYNLKLNYVTSEVNSKSSAVERRISIVVDKENQIKFEGYITRLLGEESPYTTVVDTTTIKVKDPDTEEDKEEVIVTEQNLREYLASDFFKLKHDTEKKKEIIVDLITKLIVAEDSLTNAKASEIAKKVTTIGFINGSFETYMENQSYVFSRIWKGDTSEVVDYNGNKKYDDEHKVLQLGQDQNGNDIKPSQEEVSNVNVSAYFSDYMGYVTDPYQYYLEAGDNYLTISSIKEFLYIESLEVCEVQNTVDYEQYLNNLKLQGITPQNTEKYSYRIEGEACSTTSSPTLYPITDRTCSNTYPYSPKSTKLNSIGGESWKVLGDWIIWEFDVPEDGFYNISMRVRQNLVRGMYSHRMVYIDGEIPFNELKSTVFSFSSEWQNVTLGSNESNMPYDIYLEAGHHEIKMEVTLGAYGELIEELEAVTQELSELYLNIIKYTTASPDTNRDYGLTKKSDLRLNERLAAAKATLESISKEIARLSSENSDQIDEKGDGEIYKDGRSDKTGVIDTMVEQIDTFLAKSTKITKQLGSFSTNISSLGTLLSDLREFPLTIDYLVVYSAHSDYEMQEANEGFFKSTWNAIVSFYYSFRIDYSEIGSADVEKDENLEELEIEVWMTLGRDQANVIRKLIDNDFSKKAYNINGRDVHISVNLKLTGTDVLLKASLAGVGPDVAINVDSGLPVNYGLRHASLDLAGAYGEEYWDFVSENFLPSTIRQFTFNGATYAVPEKQNYMMMFVRTNIMEQLYGAEWESFVPETWDDVRSIMTDLQTNQLQFYLPVNDAGASALNPAFVTMLYQNGGQLYSDDAKETGLLEPVAMDTFEYWTDFYTKYSFPKYASFINRFRSGEMPLGISYYEMYNTLAVFAPEIRGEWAFYPIPGTEITIENAENDAYHLSDSYPYTVVDHTSVASGTAAIIIEKNALADEDVKWGAWEFLKWWTGEAQDEFGKEMEGILGSSARHATANYNSFIQLAWPKADQQQLSLQWGYGDHNPRDGQIAVDDPNNFYLKVKDVYIPDSAYADKARDYITKDLYSYEYKDGRYHVYGVREIPQIAGSYITGREVENAYRAVINNNYNAKETLYAYAQNINNEIDRKRSEFNLD